MSPKTDIWQGTLALMVLKTLETMGPQLAEFFGTGGAGILVHSVDADSPAAKAGLHAGDVVIRANSVKLMTTGDWMKVVRENRGREHHRSARDEHRR